MAAEAWPRYKFAFWMGLTGKIVIYCLYYLYFIYSLSREIPSKAVYVLKFVFVLAAYAVGSFGLRKNAAPGLMQLWHFVYVVSLALLVLLGMYNWYIARAPISVREVAENVQELLISPILYVVIGIISYRKGL